MQPDEVIGTYLAGAGIDHARTGEHQWSAMLRGERKLTIPVSLTVRGDVLLVESFFMRRPQENLDRFYELLLRRNARSFVVSFALDGLGDVYLVGQRGTAGLSEAELDRIMGAILVEADGMFDAAIETGYATYLAADRRWRETTGTPLSPPPS